MFFARASIAVVLASVVVGCSKAAAAAEHDKHKQPRLRGLSAQFSTAASDADEYEYIDITDPNHNAVDWVKEEDSDVAPLDDLGELADYDNFAIDGAEEEDWADENDPIPDSDVFDDEDFAHVMDWLMVEIVCSDRSPGSLLVKTCDRMIKLQMQKIKLISLSMLHIAWLQYGIGISSLFRS